MADPKEHPQQREVVVDDPELTHDANRALTAEARKALGAKRVDAKGRKGAAELGGGTDSTFTAVMSHNRLLIAFSLSVVLLVGVIATLATDRWIFLGVAVLAHAAVTVVWAFLMIHLAGEPEHAAPDVAAMLEEEGVSDPDARLGEIVDDFRGEGQHGGRSEPAQAVEESAPAFMIWLPAAGLLVVSALTPFLTDGTAIWLVPVILWPLVLGTLGFAWGKPEGMGDAVSGNPRAFAIAVACGVLGLALLVLGALTA